MVQGRFASTYQKLANTKQPKERPTTTSDGHVVATLEPCFDGASYVAGDHLTFPPVYILYILHIYQGHPSLQKILANRSFDTYIDFSSTYDTS